VTTRLISSGIVRSNERKPGFNVGNRDVQLGSGKRPGKRGVGVTIHDKRSGFSFRITISSFKRISPVCVP